MRIILTEHTNFARFLIAGILRLKERIQGSEVKIQNKKIITSYILLFLNLIQDLFVFFLDSCYWLLISQNKAYC